MPAACESASGAARFTEAGIGLHRGDHGKFIGRRAVGDADDAVGREAVRRSRTGSTAGLRSATVSTESVVVVALSTSVESVEAAAWASAQRRCEIDGRGIAGF